jgi:hypothetical protein
VRARFAGLFSSVFGQGFRFADFHVLNIPLKVLFASEFVEL